jgi:hypothetical protein
MENITYQEASEIFADAVCVSVPYKYHNMDTIEPMQLYLSSLSKETGEDLINATLLLDKNQMHIISPSEHYIVNDVNSNDYDAFYICRAYKDI